MEQSQNIVEKYTCEHCNYITSKFSDWKKHNLTRKHLVRTNLEQKKTEMKFSCKRCNKEYNARNSLWYHEKKCTNKEPSPDPTTIHAQYLEIINKLLTENRELRQKLT
jgi:hypothetical protein